LSCLITAVDPDTGAKLTELDINTEAFAMMYDSGIPPFFSVLKGCSVAGSHTTSGTLTLLFSHLLQNPSILKNVVEELDNNLSNKVDVAYPVDGLERNLTYTMACIQENFRINPVFTMPLMRRVTAKEGIIIDGHFVPRGVSSNVHGLR
jgi:Cytochrome P450